MRATEYTELSWLPRTLSRLLPPADREAIAGDLIEEAAYRGLRGGRRTWWVSLECAAILAGLSIERIRAWFVVAPIREIVSGMAMDGWWTVRGGRAGSLVRWLALCGSIATLALGVELLVRTLLAASGY